MFSKLISKFKNTDTQHATPAEVAALASIDTLEKAAALVEKLAADMGETPTNSPRWFLLSRQHEQATIALGQHKINADRKRVASATKRDQAKAGQDASKADESHKQAVAWMKEVQAKSDAITARLHNLQADFSAKQQNVDNKVAAAQSEFDAAIEKGDADAEVMASESLFKAQQDCKNNAVQCGALELRIKALQCTQTTCFDALKGAENEVTEALQAQLDVQAELSLIKYDIQVQALLDAYLEQFSAVRVAENLWHKKDAGPRSLFQNCSIAEFNAQISSPERIVFGSRIDVFSRQRLPLFTSISMAQVMEKVPNLSVLATNVADLPLEQEIEQAE